MGLLNGDQLTLVHNTVKEPILLSPLMETPLLFLDRVDLVVQKTYLGRLTLVTASTGALISTTSFGSGGNDNIIFNECWGV